MANGIYVATSGTVARLQQMEVLAQNLANAKVAGFKRDEVSFKEVINDRRGDAPADDDKSFVQTTEVRTRLEDGQLRETQNPMDIAITGDGFLRVETARGERLTRNGRLMMGKDGSIRTQTGLKVLGEDGNAIFAPPIRYLRSTNRAGSRRRNRAWKTEPCRRGPQFYSEEG